MQPSIFNVRVPLPGRDVFLMNTISDAQAIVGPEVAALLDRLSDSPEIAVLDEADRAALAQLAGHGFVVPSRAAERQRLDEYFNAIRTDASEMRVTVLTTLQCNFACDYCIQGDHGPGLSLDRMTLETADRVVAWVEERLELSQPRRLGVTFFGGEPLLNLPALYRLAERFWGLAQARGIEIGINIITNGLLLTPAIVDRLLPYGLNSVKVTLDGDRETHDRMRPLRGGQGTFDRIIDNIRSVADRCAVSIGGNFDEGSAASFPALLDFLKAQEFAGRLTKVAFKPVVKNRAPARPTRAIPLTPVGTKSTPLNGTCLTSVGAAVGSACDTCHFADDTFAWLREETKARGFPTVDGVHMGPCELHRDHAYTIGPDGSLYACPGFTGDPSQSTGHIDGRTDDRRMAAAAGFAVLAPWKQCGDCSFIPVCGGGCSVAAHTELGDMHAPACHKGSFESAVTSLARDAAAVALEAQ